MLLQAILGLLLPGHALLGTLSLLGSAPLLALVLLRWSRDARDRELGFGLVPARAPILIPAALAGWAACWGSAALFTVVVAGPDSDPFANPFFDLISDSTPNLRWRLLLEACVWAPIFEELGFRAALFGALRRRLPFLPAALVSAVIFGLVHSYDAAGMAAIAVVGFVLAAVYERTRSILAGMAAHALFNLGQLQLTFLLFS
ncbi:MAG: CPBP family intramembrane glutamic endopeptidase [Planctomycetota bacterium]